MDLSILIPTYNRLDMLVEAVESCRETACTSEIIVVDDGSTDGTWEWLHRQTGIVALRQDNWGKPWAVNKALAIAKGTYVRFLDSDDWVLPGANDAQVEIGTRERADIVVAGYSEHSEDKCLVGVTWWTECDDFIAQQLGECNSSHYSAYLFRRDFVQDIPHRPDFAMIDDRLLVIEAAMQSPRVALYDGIAFGHRHHSAPRLQTEGGLRRTAAHFQQLGVYGKTLALLERRGDLTDRRKQAAARALWPLAHWIAVTHPEDGAGVAQWVRELDPSFVPPEAGALGWMYRRAGFKLTEQTLGLRRQALRLARRGRA